jgi:hypothetical protein
VQENGWGGVTELAGAIGRSKEYVSHRIALLKLPKDVLDLISTDKLMPSSANELVWLNEPKDQHSLAEILASKKLPTIKVRQAVRMMREGLSMNETLRSIGIVDRNGSKNIQASSKEQTKNRKYARLLDKSILALRICMVRLDSIIEELDSTAGIDNLKHILIQKRLLIHNQIDELIQLKKSGPFLR